MCSYPSPVEINEASKDCKEPTAQKLKDVAEALKILQEAIPILSESLPVDYSKQSKMSSPNDYIDDRKTVYGTAERQRLLSATDGSNCLEKSFRIPVTFNVQPRFSITSITTTVPEQITPSPSLGRRKFTRRQWMILLSMLLLNLVSFAIMSVLAPFFPNLVIARNLSSSVDGVIFCVYALVLFIASPIIARMIPIFSAKNFYLGGIVITATANFVFGLLPLIDDNSLFILCAIVIRSIGALGTASFLTVIYCLVPCIFPDDLNTVLGMLETAVGVGMCLGPAVGVWLYSLGGFCLPFFTFGGFLLLVLPLSCFIFPINLEYSSAPQHTFCSIITKAGIVLPSLILIVTGICQSCIYPTLQPHMGNLGISVKMGGMVFLLNSAVYSVAAPLVGMTVDRWNFPQVVLISGLFLTSIALVLLGNSPMLPELRKDALIKEDIVAIMLHGLSIAMCLVPTYGIMLKCAQVDQNTIPNLATYALISGIWSASYSLGDMIGPLYAGILTEYCNFAHVTTYTAIFPFFLAIIVLVYNVTKRIQERSVSCYQKI